MSLQQRNPIKPIVEKSLLLQTLSWWADGLTFTGTIQERELLEQSLKDMWSLPQPPFQWQHSQCKRQSLSPQCGSFLLSRRLSSSERRRNNRWLCNKQFLPEQQSHGLLEVNLAALKAQAGWQHSLWFVRPEKGLRLKQIHPVPLFW